MKIGCPTRSEKKATSIISKAVSKEEARELHTLTPHSYLIELPYLPSIRALRFSINQRYPTGWTDTSLHQDASKTDSQLSPTSPDDIRGVLSQFFKRCQISYSEQPYDLDLHNLCLKESHKNGYPVDSTSGQLSILKGLPVGVVIAATSYTRLHDREIQVFIALYTAFLVYLDDSITRDISGVDLFHERFIGGQPQANEVLESLACFLRGIHTRYSEIQANLIMTSTLKFITSVMLEHMTQNIQPSPFAYGYPTFARYLSGASEAYAFLILPPHIALSDYIQSLPEMSMFVNCANDVLSFYKEERDGDRFNYTSIQARFRRRSKLEIFKGLADDVATSWERVMRIIDSKEEAKAAFEAFSRGYVDFHTS
ncbi:hypothetical protein NLJ89_g1736 [Agrocybe chaxingu]|uniref:Terpenoid synthase n=1 Tax=Agrocybe chaxingu TaxID=84603 RepID=A0A9W8TDV5_9AGAR|nr:hypothetical protein NLJ89_g1736 [Agrocybe chaxingu]